MTRYAAHVSSRVTPQSEAIPGSTQVANSAGGFIWKVSPWVRLERFLILGNEGGSYYASEKALTKEAAAVILECASIDMDRTIKTITSISFNGRAPKNDPAIFALAMLCHSKQALEALPEVCRIGTHLFQFVDAATQFRGWGRSLRTAVAKWYENKTPLELAYQLSKYQQRGNWSHHDVLHKCHAKPVNPEQSACYLWAKNGKVNVDTPLYLLAVEQVKASTSPALTAELISRHRLPREVVPTEHLNSPVVWHALLENMPMTAMIRNLGKMSAVGLIKPLSEASTVIVNRLSSADKLRDARVHPIALLMAQSIYANGHGLKGSLTWAPDARIVDALDGAFHSAFQFVEPTGKRHLLALDVSGSMESGQVGGSFLTPRQASAAMAMVTVRSEELTHSIAFSDKTKSTYYHSYVPDPTQLHELAFTKNQTLREAVATVSGLPFMGTDCSLPMLYAMGKGLEVDVFIIYTDSETWAGRIHPSQALQQYRQKTGINAKLIVVGMVSNSFTIADPQDEGMLDCVGFDTNVPLVMRDFIAN